VAGAGVDGRLNRCGVEGTAVALRSERADVIDARAEIDGAGCRRLCGGGQGKRSGSRREQPAAGKRVGHAVYFNAIFSWNLGVAGSERGADDVVGCAMRSSRWV